ncbi:hypothetical protein [Sporomusa sphaeroides]|uniref:Uncharacterized protein n=1 Tax=Sporomusa sphaeroides DSM 2875 TaxID=1337886 RepID=A0ABP2C395_9FIRM|nr:hypothetical protein [Sporomusa sphaeroides]OLS56385.1 hypothetical protein SPSPH_27780 [Sporomusa sphaeroides DSM 2875]CVK18480.1 hypothetical protein SSPH_01118 [Sporomusa sphaeroides DSM 2875]
MSECIKYDSAYVEKARAEGKTFFGSAVIDGLLQENADLRARLEAAEKEIAETDQKIADAYKACCLKMLDMSAIFDNQQHKINNLQAAYEVVRGALDCIAGLTTHEWENKIARKALKDCSYIKCHVCKYEPSCDYEPHTERCLAKYSKVDQALSTTPEQAGERVQYLVTVATDTLAWLKQNKLGDTGHGRCLAEALAKYRGGADGE